MTVKLKKFYLLNRKHNYYTGWPKLPLKYHVRFPREIKLNKQALINGDWMRVD